MSTQKPSFVPGGILIIIGLWFLARRIFYFTDYWDLILPFLLIGFSLFFFFETVRRKRTETLFWGVVLFLIALFFIARNFNWIEYYFCDEYWPIFLLAPGLAFIAQFIMRPQNWGVLIPGCILLFIGVGSSFHSFNYSFWEMKPFFNKFWPVLIIFLGILILIGGFRRRMDHDEN